MARNSLLHSEPVSATPRHRLRFLHTADWHLGQSFHGLNREAEHQAFLDWLLERLDETAADALLVTGDVFDSSNPPVTAQHMFYDFLARARRRCPGLQIIITAGNHDSGSRLDAPAPLLRELAVHMVGSLGWLPDGRLDNDRLLIPLRNHQNQIAAVCAAIPYLRACDLATAARNRAPESDAASLAPENDSHQVQWIYQQAVAALRAVTGPLQAAPLLTGHCAIAGGDLSAGSERRLLVGGLQGLPVEMFPDDMAYVALGHLHRSQKVAGREGCRYSGSPLPLAMDEAGYRHQVLCVNLEPDENGWQPEVTVLPVPRTVPLLRIPSAGPPQRLAATLAAVESLAAELANAGTGGPRELWPYLDVAVILDSPEPNLREKIHALLKDRAVRLVRLVVNPAGSTASLSPETLGEDLATLQPEEVFSRLHHRTCGTLPTGPLMMAFQELLAGLDATESLPAPASLAGFKAPDLREG